MASQYIKDGKIKFKPKRHHGFSALLFILGTLFPPLAVGARFGIGSDFWLNLLLTICGYIPGHVHNFYIQNVRNNNNKKRTPKWAVRYGLIDASEIKRKQKKSEWAYRYNERLPQSTLEGQEYEEGQIPDAAPDPSAQEGAAGTRPGHQFWREEDESFYSNGRGTPSSESGGRWSYPANFDDAVMPEEGGGKKKKKVKKDRFARTEDAYSLSEETSGKKKKKKKNKSTVGDDYVYNRSNSSVNDPEALDAGRDGGLPDANVVGEISRSGERRDEFDHEF